MGTLRNLLEVLRRRDMDLMFAYSPETGLVTDEGSISGLDVEARDIRLGLPFLHDEEDLENSVRIEQAAAEVIIDLAREGVLDRNSRVIAEYFLEGISYPEGGKPHSFPEIREIRTIEDYRRLNLRANEGIGHSTLPNHHLVFFTVDDKDYNYLTLRGDSVVTMFPHLAAHEIPLVFGDDETLRKGTRSEHVHDRLLSDALRRDNFRKQLFAPGEGMQVLIAGVLDFPDPGGVALYFKEKNLTGLYIQAVHQDFKNSKYLQSRPVKKD